MLTTFPSPGLNSASRRRVSGESWLVCIIASYPEPNLRVTGAIRPRNLGREELRCADRRILVPGSRAGVAALQAPADVPARAGLHRRAPLDCACDLADHGCR